jgi:hypothetical protein
MLCSERNDAVAFAVSTVSVVVAAAVPGVTTGGLNV